jgi:hypothetical protein
LPRSLRRPVPEAGFRVSEITLASRRETRCNPLATCPLEAPLSRADYSSIVLPALIVGGLLFGAVVGRWWTLLAAIAIGAYVGLTEEVEVSGWVLGVGYGVVAAFGIAIGVLIHRGLSRSKAEPS